MDVNRTALAALSDLEPLVEHGLIEKLETKCGATIFDFGVTSRGGLHAGLVLARLLMSDLAQVSCVPSSLPQSGNAIAVTTDNPLWACIGSQYAGWPISGDGFFAMGSGPMRSARGKEKVLAEYELIQPASTIIGGLEVDKIPPEDVIEAIADECSVQPSSVVLFTAPVTSLAGTVQVVARSIETAIHKLHELKFDLRQIVSGFGVAILPPPAASTMQGIGRTNDAILYGADVTLYVRSEDELLESLAPQVPSQSSSAFGQPFAEIFKAHNNDFYKIDPLLFSPALVRLTNIDSGRTFVAGELRPDVLEKSFNL